MDCATAGQNGRRQACPTSHCKVSRGISSKTASVVAGKPKPRSGEPDWCSYSAIAGSPKPRSGEPDWYPYDVHTPEALAFGSCPEKSKKDAIANCSNHILGQGSAEPKEGFGRTGVRTLLTDKLLFEGAETLTDCEMLQVALSLASPKGRPATVATNLLTHLGSYAAVLWAEDDCLLRVPGVNHRHISMLKTLRLGAVHSLRRDAFRSSLRGDNNKLRLYLQASLGRERVEQFRVLFLNNHFAVITEEILGRGTINHVPVYPRMVAERAYRTGAFAIVMAHNHPSGDPTPSPQDLDMTSLVDHTLAKLGIWLYDHFIIGKKNSISLRCEGFCSTDPPCDKR